MEIVIVTGLSGAGKSKALKILEDIGFYCIDNIMPQLVQDVIDTCLKSRETVALNRLAIGIDVRGGVFFSGIFSVLESLKHNKYRYKVLFLDARDTVLVARYKETRREHPLSSRGLVETGINKERELLNPLKDLADIVIDTSDIKEGELKQKLYNIFPSSYSASSDVTIVSFGFKRGTPADCDMVYDVRFLPNPHYVPELKPFNGTNKEVAEFVYSDPLAEKFVVSAAKHIELILPSYKKNVKPTLIVGIGCTGGKHRSVATACHLADILSEAGFNVSVEHRELFIE